MTANPYESAEYQRFIESMIPHCRCEYDQPCDGVLAGGLCDEKKFANDEDDERCDECGHRESLCNCWP